MSYREESRSQSDIEESIREAEEEIEHWERQLREAERELREFEGNERTIAPPMAHLQEWARDHGLLINDPRPVRHLAQLGRMEGAE